MSDSVTHEEVAKTVNEVMTDHNRDPKVHSMDALKVQLAQHTEQIAAHEEQIRKLSKAIETHRKEKNQGFFDRVKLGFKNHKFALLLLGFLGGGVASLAFNPALAGIGAAISQGVLTAGAGLLSALGINKAPGLGRTFHQGGV